MSLLDAVFESGSDLSPFDMLQNNSGSNLLLESDGKKVKVISSPKEVDPKTREKVKKALVAGGITAGIAALASAGYVTYKMSQLTTKAGDIKESVDDVLIDDVKMESFSLKKKPKEVSNPDQIDSATRRKVKKALKVGGIAAGVAVLAAAGYVAVTQKQFIDELVKSEK